MPAFSMQYPWKSIVWAFRKSPEIPKSTSASRATARAKLRIFGLIYWKRFGQLQTNNTSWWLLRPHICFHIRPLHASLNGKLFRRSYAELRRAQNRWFSHFLTKKCMTNYRQTMPVYGLYDHTYVPWNVSFMLVQTENSLAVRRRRYGSTAREKSPILTFLLKMAIFINAFYKPKLTKISDILSKPKHLAGVDRSRNRSNGHRSIRHQIKWHESNRPLRSTGRQLLTVTSLWVYMNSNL